MYIKHTCVHGFFFNNLADNNTVIDGFWGEDAYGAIVAVDFD